MSDFIRESPLGQVIRFMTRNKVLQYPEERPDFVVPPSYLRAHDSEKQAEKGHDQSPSTTSTPPAEKELDQPPPAQSIEKELDQPGPAPFNDVERQSSRSSHESVSTLGNPQGAGEVERVKSLPITPQRTSDGMTLVTWYTTDDPANPYNWSLGRRNFVCSIISLYTFVVYCGSAIYTSSVEGVVQHFGVSEIAASLPLSLYVLAYGIGPMLFAPLSEIPIIGRSPVYMVTFFLFVILSIPTAFVNNFAGLLVLRFLQGFFGSPCLANGGASLGDLYNYGQLPFAMTFWVASSFCGPALGPLISGFAVSAKGWRWSLYEIIWMSAPIMILMFLCLPETSTPNILLRRARRLRRLTGNDRLHSQSEIDQKHIKPSAVIIDALIKPFEITIKDPAIAFVNLYTSLVYGIYYSFFEVFPLVYPVLYNMNIGETGLVFLCVLVAVIIAIAIYVSYLRFYLMPDIMKNGMRPQEHRLLPALLGCFGPPIGMFLFAWTANRSIHWIVPTIGIVIYSATVFIVLQCVFVYVPMSYPKYAASLFAGNDFLRSAFACGSILFSRPMFLNLGIGKGVSLLGGLSCIGIIGMYVLYYTGAKLRAASRFATG